MSSLQKEDFEVSTGGAFEKRGVTLELLVAIRDEALKRNASTNFWSIGAISAYVNGNHEILNTPCRWGHVDPMSTFTFEGKCSLVEWLRREHSSVPHPVLGVTYSQVVGPATVFLSFAYSSDFIELVDGIQCHMQANSDLLPESTFFWFDLLVNDQWHAMEKDFNWWANTFSNAVKEIGYTLCFFSSWDHPTYITRVWCLFELSCSRRIEIALSNVQRTSFYATLRKNFVGIAASLCAINLEDATSYLPADRERVFEVIRTKGGFHSFNCRVADSLRAWIHCVSCQLVLDNEDKVSNSDITGTSSDGTMLSAAQSLLLDKDRVSVLLHRQGKLPEAEVLARQVIEGYELLHPVDDALYEKASAIHNLALILTDQGKFAEGEVMYRRSLAAKRAILGEAHDVLEFLTMNNLANLLKTIGKLDEAETLFVQSLEGFEKLLGLMDPNTLAAVNNYAGLLSDKGRLSESEAMYHRALDGRTEVLGASHSDTMCTLGNLALVTVIQGKLLDAEPLFRQVLEEFEKSMGQDHIHTLIAVSNLGELCNDLGKLKEAEALHERALTGLVKCLGPIHPQLMEVLSNYARCLEGQDRPVEAVELRRREVKGRMALQCFGATHPTTLAARHKLAAALRGLSRFDEALPLLEQLIADLEPLGIDHSCLFHKVQHETGLLLRAIGDGATITNLSSSLRAMNLLQAAYEGLLAANGPNHPDTLNVLACFTELSPDNAIH